MKEKMPDLYTNYLIFKTQQDHQNFCDLENKKEKKHSSYISKNGEKL